MTLSPKHLNFDEMWQLYKLLEKGIGAKQEEYLIDELVELLGKVSKENYLLSLSLLYNNKIEYSKLTPIDSVTMLIDGLTLNKFFDFVTFVQRMPK